MSKLGKIENAIDAAYHEFQKYCHLRSMTDKINCDIEVYFTQDELDAMLDLLKDYLSYLIIAKEEEIRKLQRRYIDHDQKGLQEIAEEVNNND